MSSIYSNKYAFAALKADGGVITWGMNRDSGDKSKVKGHLTTGVQSICRHCEGTDCGFAGAKSDDTIVYWGAASAKSGAVKKACKSLTKS